MNTQRNACFAKLVGAAALALAMTTSASADEPLLFVSAGEDAANVTVAAGAEHAGDTLFLVVVGPGGHALESLDRGLVLDARSLDAYGQAFGPLPEIAALTGAPVDLGRYELRAIVMDDDGEFHVSTGVAMAAIGKGKGGLDGDEDDDDGGITTPGGGTAGMGGGGGAPTIITVAAIPGPVGPIQPCLIVPPCTGGNLPDLIVTSLVLNTTTTSTACTGAPLPFVGCPNGRFFMITATVRNVGTCGIKCGKSISLKWGMGLTPGSIMFEFFNQTLPTQGLPPGASMTFTRPYYMGPCDVVNPTFHLNYFSAIVDPLNAIAESNEANNQFTPPTPACNFD